MAISLPKSSSSSIRGCTLACLSFPFKTVRLLTRRLPTSSSLLTLFFFGGGCSKDDEADKYLLGAVDGELVRHGETGEIDASRTLKGKISQNKLCNESFFEYYYPSSFSCSFEC